MKTSRVELVEVAPALPTLKDLIKKRKSNYVKTPLTLMEIGNL